MEKELKESNEESFFDRPEMEATLFWSRFASAMRSITGSKDFMFNEGKRKVSLFESLSGFSHDLDYIKSLLFKTYGLVLDTNPNHKECVEDLNHDHLVDLYFWSMDYQKEIEFIINNSSNIAYELDNIKYDIKRPFQVRRIINTLLAIFSLLANAMKMPVMLLSDFDVYLKEFRKSERGEALISGWRKEYLLSREQLLLQLKEIKSYNPWVDKCRLQHEGKIEKRELFIDKTIPGAQHNAEITRTNTWFSIFTILSVLNEYDEQQEVVRKMKPYFKFNEDEVRRFLIEIQGAEPPLITALVKKLADDKTATEEIKSKSFWRILVDNKLYDKGYQNWNDQV